MISCKKRDPNYQKDQRAFFNSMITDGWQTYSIPEWDFTRIFETRWIAERTNPVRVLDVGCGCGFHDEIMAQQAGVEKVLGIDYSEKSIEIADLVYPHEKVKRKQVDFLKDNIKALGCFDLVMSFQVIEHVEEYELFLKKMASVTEDGGFIAVATPNYNCFANRIRAFFGKEKVFCDAMHAIEFTYDELKHLGEGLGLTLYDSMSYNCSLNFKFDLDKYIPHRIRFYLGRMFPSIGNVMVLIFQK